MFQAERYRLMRTVASGGMAQIVEAVACGLHGFERRVAIKRLLPEHARDRERRRMFLEEAMIGSRLHHGGIVSIFDYGIIDGSEFLAMEYVDGMDALRAVANRAHEGEGSAGYPMSEGIALHVVAEVSHALAYVHGLSDERSDGSSSGIIHRDVSPANILLSWNGDVRLSDFGIALSGATRGQAMGAVSGKLRYMAPEQARGEAVSTAADVYALGATLDALLGGWRVSDPTAKPSDVDIVEQARRRGTSPATCALIGACIATDPRRRPGAAEVAARAGAMASVKLGRDGRGALRDWLAPLRDTARRQGMLDDLMGLALIPVSPESARTFTVTRVGTSEQDRPARRTGRIRVLRGGRRANKLGRARRFWTHISRVLSAIGLAVATLLVWRVTHLHH